MHLLQQRVVLDSLHLVQQFLNHFVARFNLHVDLLDLQVKLRNRLLEVFKVNFNFLSFLL